MTSRIQREYYIFPSRWHVRYSLQFQSNNWKPENKLNRVRAMDGACLSNPFFKTCNIFCQWNAYVETLFGKSRRGKTKNRALLSSFSSNRCRLCAWALMIYVATDISRCWRNSSRYYPIRHSSVGRKPIAKWSVKMTRSRRILWALLRDVFFFFLFATLFIDDSAKPLSTAQ